MPLPTSSKIIRLFLVAFLHKIVDGQANKSYGIHVAKIAGVPSKIRISAEKKLKELEKSSLSIGINNNMGQIKFFDEIDDATSNNDKLIDALYDIEIDNITPIDALNKLNELKQMI